LSVTGNGAKPNDFPIFKINFLKPAITTAVPQQSYVMVKTKDFATAITPCTMKTAPCLQFVPEDVEKSKLLEIAKTSNIVFLSSLLEIVVSGYQDVSWYLTCFR
jgi:hypothetical protein